MPETQPVLVLLSASCPAPALDRLRQKYRVISLLEPRLAILELNAAQYRQLQAEPEVDALVCDAISGDLLAALADQERLFVQAWCQGQVSRSRSEPRPGEGLAWDAPGFQPPGPPSEGRP